MSVFVPIPISFESCSFVFLSDVWKIYATSFVVLPQASFGNLGSFMVHKGFPCSSVSKESACNAGDLRSIPGLRRSPGEGNGNSLQNPCLENSMDRGTWRTTVPGIFQARLLKWVAISFSRGSSQPRDQTSVSCIAGRRFTI